MKSGALASSGRRREAMAAREGLDASDQRSLPSSLCVTTSGISAPTSRSACRHAHRRRDSEDNDSHDRIRDCPAAAGSGRPVAACCGAGFGGVGYISSAWSAPP